MGAEVVDDRVALLAVDHRGVERPEPPREAEPAGPRDRLAAEPVDVGVVGDRERHVPAPAGEQHPPGRAEQEERQRPPRAPPHLVHDAGADLAGLVDRREPEAPLHLRVEPVEVVAERVAVDRGHGRSSTSGWRSGAVRSGRRPLGRPSCVASATPASAATAMPSDPGLNARVRIERSDRGGPDGEGRHRRQRDDERPPLAGAGHDGDGEAGLDGTDGPHHRPGPGRRRGRGPARSRPRRGRPSTPSAPAPGRRTRRPARRPRRRGRSARSRDRSGGVPSSSHSRRRSKLHAVAQPNTGRNDPPVDHLAEPPPAGPVVVAGQEPDAVVGGDVAPVAGAGVDDRAPVGGPEPQARPAGAVGAVAVAERLAGAGDGDAGRDGGGVGEPLRLALDLREVVMLPNRTSQRWCCAGVLRGVPQAVHRGPDAGLDVDRPPAPARRQRARPHGRSARRGARGRGGRRWRRGRRRGPDGRWPAAGRAWRRARGPCRCRARRCQSSGARCVSNMAMNRPAMSSVWATSASHSSRITSAGTPSSAEADAGLEEPAVGDAEPARPRSARRARALAARCIELGRHRPVGEAGEQLGRVEHDGVRRRRAARRARPRPRSPRRGSGPAPTARAGRRCRRASGPRPAAGR